MTSAASDDWVRDVSFMIVAWLIATVVAGGLLLTVVRSLFL